MGKTKGSAALQRALADRGHTHAIAEINLGAKPGYISHLLAGKFSPKQGPRSKAREVYGIEIAWWDEPVKAPRKRKAVRA